MTPSSNSLLSKSVYLKDRLTRYKSFNFKSLQCSDIEEALSERQYSSFFVADNPYSPFGPSWEDFAKFLAKLSLGYSVSLAKV